MPQHLAHGLGMGQRQALHRKAPGRGNVAVKDGFGRSKCDSRFGIARQSHCLDDLGQRAAAAGPMPCPTTARFAPAYAAHALAWQAPRWPRGQWTSVTSGLCAKVFFHHLHTAYPVDKRMVDFGKQGKPVALQPSIRYISHRGRLRSSKRPCSRATRRISSSIPPGWARPNGAGESRCRNSCRESRSGKTGEGPWG